MSAELGIAERVAAGVAFLDEHDPGWDRRIDLTMIDLASPCRCVLGQLHLDVNKDTNPHFAYRNHREALGLSIDRAKDLGFDAYRDGIDDGEFEQQDEEYYDLTDEWERVILARREASHA